MALEHRVEEIKLKNGAKGLFIYVPNTTVVRYDIGFRAGIALAPKRISQVAHVMEHLAFTSDSRHSSREDFSRDFEKNGASQNAFTSIYGMSYYSYAALMEWDRILDLQGLAISQPKYTQKHLEAEKGNVREELARYLGDDHRVLRQSIYRAGGVACWYDSDELDTIDSIKIGDVLDFHKKTHSFKNMRFLIAGDLEGHRDRIVRTLESWKLPEGRRLSIPKDRYREAAPITLIRPNSPTLRFYFQYGLNRALTDQELTNMAALNHILAGTFHSRILGKARSLGICYGMSATITTRSSNDVSEWSFSSNVSIENAKRMFELIAKELNDVMRKGVSQRNLSEARGYGLGTSQMKGQTVGDLSGWYASSYFDQEKIERMDEARERISRIDSADMAEVAREFVTDGYLGFGVAGNIEDDTITRQLHEIIKSVDGRTAK